MAEAVDDPVERELHRLGVLVLKQHEAGFGGANLGDGGGHRTRQARAGGNRHLTLRLAGGDRLHQIGIEQQRRALQNRRGHIGLIAGKRMNHGRRRILAAGEHLGHRATNQRRRIVEQHDHGAFGGSAIGLTKVGLEEGPRQCARSLGAFA